MARPEDGVAKDERPVVDHALLEEVITHVGVDLTAAVSTFREDDFKAAFDALIADTGDESPELMGLLEIVGDPERLRAVLSGMYGTNRTEAGKGADDDEVAAFAIGAVWGMLSQARLNKLHRPETKGHNK